MSEEIIRHKKSRMFPFITESKFNPLGGDCHHNCYGGNCWAKLLIKRNKMKKYAGEPRIYEKELHRKFGKDDFVFVCDMCDLFGNWVPKEMIQRILDYIEGSPATFLLLTKNPMRYMEFKLPLNAVAGATIETDYETMLAGAPQRWERASAMGRLNHRKMISIEPIMDFGPLFASVIALIKPEFVAVGYDNYGCGMREPTLAQTEQLIGELEGEGIKVYRKTLREPK